MIKTLVLCSLLLLVFSTTVRADTTDVTSSFTIKAGGFVLNRTSGTFNASVTLTNQTASSYSQLWFVVYGLPSGVTVANLNTVIVNGAYQIPVPLTNNEIIPGGSVSLVVQLVDPHRVSVHPTFGVLAATGCTPGAPGCGWQTEDMVVYTQSDWGDIPNGTNAASMLATAFATMYGTFVAGDGAGYVMVFSSASTLLAYLPANGSPGPLDSDLLDPGSSSSGAFGGNVSALQLNVDFNDAGLVHGTAAARFGDLYVCDVPTTPDLDHVTVRQALSVLQRALAGVPTSDTYADLDALARALNAAFLLGDPSTFAQDHLFTGSCP